MHKIDSNEMDALFREGAEKHEFVYNPGSWDIMEEKLDKRDRRKTFLWYFLGLVVVAGSVFGYMHFNSDSTLKAPQQIIADESADSQQIEIENRSQATNTIVEKVNDTSQSSIKNSSTFEPNQKIDDKSNKETKEEYINTGSEVRSRNIGAQNSENTGSLVSNEIVSEAPTVVSKESISENIATTNGDKASKISPLAVTPSSNMKAILDTRDQLSLYSLRTNKTKSIYSLNIPTLGFDLSPKVNSKEQVVLAAISTSRYVFTAHANTEFSSIGMFKESQAGYKIGVKVGKQFLDKFQFDIGLAYSYKKYGAVGDEYTRDEGWGVDNVKPTWVDAKYKVIEVPLEISYYLKGFKNDGFFINAGISSYLVNSEWYGFKYDEENMDPQEIQKLVKEIKAEDISRKNYHLSGVGKLSVGYQKVMSSNMSFEISPYIQIPLTGIGEGKVNLYSTGVQFAMKFNSK